MAVIIKNIARTSAIGMPCTFSISPCSIQFAASGHQVNQELAGSILVQVQSVCEFECHTCFWCYLQDNKLYKHHGSWLCMEVTTSLWTKAGVGSLHSPTALYVGQLVRAGSLLHPKLKPQSDLSWSVIQPQPHQTHLYLSQSSSMASLALFPNSKQSKPPV